MISTDPASQFETTSEPRRNHNGATRKGRQSASGGQLKPCAPQKLTTFQPSARQSQLAEVLATDKDALTITALCEKAGVSRNTFYRWQHDAAFQLWLGRIAMQTLLAVSPMLLMQGVNDALNGDFRAWRTMLNFAYNPRGLVALDAFLARLEANAAKAGPTDSGAHTDESSADVTENTALPPNLGTVITAAARVSRELRRSKAKCHRPAPTKPKLKVSGKHASPPPKTSQPQASAQPQSDLPACSAVTPPASADSVSHRGNANFDAAVIPAQPSEPPSAVECGRNLTHSQLFHTVFGGEFEPFKTALAPGMDVTACDDVSGVPAMATVVTGGHVENHAHADEAWRQLAAAG